ncbi:hypothetical protein GUJ93_ZPchr0004g38293 [Zizania palustris]|uniref:Uncharacterized protein n=1 Tax=Zizania palustris TaxID=103762 RepID=A0A8J5SY49_ZIZPA|nr:hypothetical protein GUJ93_ZPchr0004g38293 [Zizania palustris]
MTKLFGWPNLSPRWPNVASQLEWLFLVGPTLAGPFPLSRATFPFTFSTATVRSLLLWSLLLGPPLGLPTPLGSPQLGSSSLGSPLSSTSPPQLWSLLLGPPLGSPPLGSPHRWRSACVSWQNCGVARSGQGNVSSPRWCCCADAWVLSWVAEVTLVSGMEWAIWELMATDMNHTQLKSTSLGKANV